MVVSRQPNRNIHNLFETSKDDCYMCQVSYQTFFLLQNAKVLKFRGQLGPPRSLDDGGEGWGRLAWFLNNRVWWSDGFTWKGLNSGPKCQSKCQSKIPIKYQSKCQSKFQSKCQSKYQSKYQSKCQSKILIKMSIKISIKMPTKNNQSSRF